MKLVFFDLETTGLNKDDEVIEIGAIKVVDLEIVATFKSLVRPNKVLPRFITNLTGITQEDLNKAQDREKIKKEFRSFIEDAILIAHNAQFDKEFLEKFFEEPVSNPIIDTLELSRLVFPEFSSHSLEKLVLALNIKSEKAHRAYNDAVMLYELFKKIMEQLKTFEDSDINLIREIIGDSRDYEFLFEGFSSGESTKLDFITTSELTLPFENSVEKATPTVLYVEESDYKNTFTKIKANKKSLVVVYSDTLKDLLLKELSNRNVFDATNLENFVCLERLTYFLDNPQKIPLEFKFDFAILVSYLLKTKDFLLENAPNHILKNRALKNLSICKGNGCNFKSICPLTKKQFSLMNSEVVIMKQSNFFNSYPLIASTKFDTIFFLEAYRLPKVFYSIKQNISKNDLQMVVDFNDFKEQDNSNVQTLFDSLYGSQELFSKAKEEILKEISNEPSGDSVERQLTFNNNSGNIVISYSNPQKFFSKIRNASHIDFVSNFIEYNGINQVEKFTGLKGQMEKISIAERVLSIIPLFTHAPNADEFLKEFVETFTPLSDLLETLFVFENKIQMNVFKMELKNRFPKIEESFMKDDGFYEFTSYEHPMDRHFRIIWLVKLPLNLLNFEEDYPMYYLKNFVLDHIKPKEKSVVLYFDSRLKDKNFLSKVEDAFISTPLPLERKDTMIQFIKKYLGIST